MLMLIVHMHFNIHSCYKFYEDFSDLLYSYYVDEVIVYESLQGPIKF